MINAVSSISSLIDHPGAVNLGPTTGPQKIGAAGTAAQPSSFADMMAQVTTNAVDTMKSGEAASIAGIQGKASVQQVVDAVTSAEQTLQIAIAIRDKVVAAYQEISRMTI